MIENKLKVAVVDHTPFIMKKVGGYHGFEIDLWESVAKEAGLNFEYEQINSFKELIPFIVDKKADVAIGAITINEEREEIVDFSHSIFDSGLGILLSKKSKNINFTGTIKTFFNEGYKQFFKPLIFLLVLVLILGSFLYFFERNNGSMSLNYFIGILQSTWVFVCSMLGLDGALFVYSVNSWAGRLIISLGQLISLAVLGLFIGELTAFITTKKIRMNISGPNDLKDKKVGTVQGTTSISILKEIGANIIATENIEEAYKKLKKGELDAVVFDSPILTYYSLGDGAGWSEMVGEMFDKQNYGIVLQEGSPFRKNINLAILTIKENGYYQTIYEKWFGKE